MRHVSLTCVNHPNLRWQCKEIAVNSIGQYNGARNIFFNGTIEEEKARYEELERALHPKDEHQGPVALSMHTPLGECKCPASDLRFSPEELELQKTAPLEPRH